MVELADMLGVNVVSEPWGDTGDVPYYLNELYNFRKVVMDGIPCIFAEPRGQAPTIPSVTKHFAFISSTSNIPVVLRINGLSNERRKALIEARVPFVAFGQVYLPFMGIILQKGLYNEPKTREKLMPSAQMLLFSYLYQSNRKLYTGLMADKIGVSAMQITRAVRQLNKLNLVEVYKEGVQVVIEGKTNHRALFESATPHLLDPVSEILYVRRDESVRCLPLAGLSALSEMTMLAESVPQTYAYYSKTDKLHGESSLIDPEKQVRVEVWKYTPTVLYAHKNTADPLSVVVSLRDERNDERIEQAIETVLREVWM